MMMLIKRRFMILVSVVVVMVVVTTTIVADARSGRGGGGASFHPAAAAGIPPPYSWISSKVAAASSVGLASAPTNSSSSSSRNITATFVFPPANNITNNFGNQALNYSIFSGRSALRDLPSEWRQRLQEDNYYGVGGSARTTTSTATTKNGKTAAAAASTKAMGALELLAAGYLDEAHEVLLGVTLEELEAAEYAASHRGQTTWNEDHPLDETDDFLHSMIHRLEGVQKGEGGYTGYQNAKYWFAGGPKASAAAAAAAALSNSWLPTDGHPVYQALCNYARQVHPNLVVTPPPPPLQSNNPSTLPLPPLIPSAGKDTTFHEIIAGGGGKNRTVQVRAGSWDGIALVDYWERVLSTSSTPGDSCSYDSSSLLTWQLYDLHCAEILLWRHYLLMQQQQQQQQQQQPQPQPRQPPLPQHVIEPPSTSTTKMTDFAPPSRRQPHGKEFDPASYFV